MNNYPETDVTPVNIIELAVAQGRVEEIVKGIRDNTERRLTNAEQFQLTARDELTNVNNRITEVEIDVASVKSSLNSSMKWITGVIAIIGIIVPIILKSM